MKFEELDLTSELLQGIKEAGYENCTPIQESVIPHILNGKDVSGLAQTGTGKTAAFLVPLMDRILRSRKGETTDRAAKNWNKGSYVLVLVPTRELAGQCEEALKLLGKHCGLQSISVVGGQSYTDQKKGLRDGVEFVIGTPGRLLDLYKTHELDLRGVNAIVFDEADRMFDMGFKDDMKFILRRVPRERQFLLFSATLNFDVLNTSYQFGAEPIEFNVSRDQATAEGVEHEIYHIGQEDKPRYLLSILKRELPSQCIVFSNFKQNVSRVARFLKANGFEAMEISSLLSQPQRNKVMEQFKSGEVKILVATDVAARGLDIKGVDLVINFELPDDPEGYVHRIGRTGRAGAKGKAFGLVSDRDVEAIQRIETYLKEKVNVGWMEDKDIVKEYADLPPEESDRRGPAGPRGRTSSAPSRGPRPERPQRGAAPRSQHQDSKPPVVGKNAQAQGASQAQGDEYQLPSALTGQHRDRHTGRHNTEPGAAPNTRGGRPQVAAGHKNTSGRKPQARSGQAPARTAHKPAARGSHAGAKMRGPIARNKMPKPGVATKVKNFIGKLFGGGKKKPVAKSRS